MTDRRTLEARLGAHDAATIEALLAEARAGAFVLRPRGASRGRDILLDTSDWALARRATILVLRRRGAAADLEASRSRPGAAPWRETRRTVAPLERPPRAPLRLPHGPLALSLSAVVARRPLSAVAELTYVRRGFDALDARGELSARVLVESVSATIPGSTASIRFDEVAVAPVTGCAAGAALLVAALRARGLSAEARSGRARALAALHGEAVFASRFAGRVGASDTLADAARKTVAEHLGRLQDNDPGTRAGVDPESLHDQRVASRRLRAALRFFEPAFPESRHERLTYDLRWLGRRLGRVRDLDVQLERLAKVRLEAGKEGDSGVETLARLLDAQRVEARRVLLSALDGARYVRLIRDLDAFALGAPGPEPAPAAAVEEFGPTAAAALVRAWRRFRRDGKRAAARPEPQALHALRIRAKRLRYALEFIADAAGKPGRRLVARLVRLQDLLGAHQDAVVGAGIAARTLARERLTRAQRAGVESACKAEARIAARLRARFVRAWPPFARDAFRRDVERVVARLAGESDKKNGDAVSGVP